ncbi:MAG: DMT family transporter [Clostridium sp.]|nr:DMT family transporter [Clostridium sp.]
MENKRNAGSKHASAILTHLGALTAILFWGLSFVSTSYIMTEGHLSPTEAFVYRFLVAYAVIFAISHKRLWCNNLHDEAMMLLIGLSGSSIYFIAENTALELTLPANVSLLSSTSPLVTVLLVGLLYKSERPGLGMIIGSIVAFIGVVCVIFNSFAFETEGVEFKISPLGDLLALSTAFCWAVYSLLLKRVNVVYDAMFITRKTFFYGLITAIPFLALEPTLANPLVAFSNPYVLGNLLFLALGASILGFYLWARTVAELGAIKANNYMYLQPIVTLIGAAIILHDPISFFGVLGLVLVLFGLWLGECLEKKWACKGRCKG